MFEVGADYLTSDSGTTYRVRAISVTSDYSKEFKTEYATLEDAEKELRGLKIYLRQNHSHVDTDANYTKIV
jgi:hypothetical protein